MTEVRFTIAAVLAIVTLGVGVPALLGWRAMRRDNARLRAMKDGLRRIDGKGNWS